MKTITLPPHSPERAAAKAGWERELFYICQTKKSGHLASFNDDPECFKRYCEMQANIADREGFPEVAKKIREEVINGKTILL